MTDFKLKWYSILILACFLFVWRVGDFVTEAFDKGFKMTQAGVLVFGSAAGILEVIIIFGTIGIIGMAITVLMNLYSENPFE